MRGFSTQGLMWEKQQSQLVLEKMTNKKSLRKKAEDVSRNIHSRYRTKRASQQKRLELREKG